MGAGFSGTGGKPGVAGGLVSDATQAEPETFLERVRDRQRDKIYAVRCTIRKLVTHCPLTGVPFYSYIVLDYVPDGWLVDARALERYVRDTKYFGAFHETSTLQIAQALLDLLAPKWLRVGGYWSPTNGVPIEVYFQSGPKPADIWVPDQMPPEMRAEF